MNDDELLSLIFTVFKSHFGRPLNLHQINGCKAIAAAIRSRFCLQEHDYAKYYGNGEYPTKEPTDYGPCDYCGQPKPGPAPADERKEYSESEKAIRERADRMEAEELKRAEHGEDTEAIKLWRGKK